jgi:6-phosphogluconolactonase
MTASAQLLVFVTMFAADQAGGIQAFHLDPAKGTLAPAAVTRDCPNGFFLTLSPADSEEVIAWRVADRAGTLEQLGRRPAKGPVSCYTATDPSGRALLIAHYNGATVAALPLGADGSLAGDPVALRHEGKGADPGRQEAPHPHAIIPAPAAEGRPQFAYAADLGADAIFS